MSNQFMFNLSKNYIGLLEDDEYYDVTIEVGEDPNVKIFRAHMNILCCRSPYLRRVLSSNQRNNNDVLNHLKLQNIAPEIFQIILKFIYGGVLSLDEQDASDILKMLTAADKLLLQELVDYLQKYLLEKKSEWMEQHFELTYLTGFQSSNFLALQKFCTDLMAASPEKIFKSFDFTSLSESALVSLIKRDDLQMKEIEVWEHVLKWGLAQNSTLIPDPSTWIDDDFNAMKITLQQCLPLIRFFSLSSKEFFNKVRPYKKLLRSQLYEDLVSSFMDPDSTPNEGVSIPRNIKIDGIIDTKIVNFNIISTISRWIDKIEINKNFSHLRELYFPYKFKLLLRGSRDGFTPKTFHELCDEQPYTVAFIKVKGTEEIIGGYNPLIWKIIYKLGESKDSFIFSFKNRGNCIENAVLSNICNSEKFAYNENNGPCFGKSDIFLGSSNVLTNYDVIHCKKGNYEKNIMETEDEISIEDYEVFRIIKK